MTGIALFIDSLSLKWCPLLGRKTKDKFLISTKISRGLFHDSVL